MSSVDSRSESNHATSPKPITAQKLWTKTKREAESSEAGPPNDQTRTMKIELLIKTSNKNNTCSTSVGSGSLGRWFYNWDSHWNPKSVATFPSLKAHASYVH